ncbi:hypothetical protein Gpo141_00000053 [Globisporangium polare]
MFTFNKVYKQKFAHGANTARITEQATSLLKLALQSESDYAAGKGTMRVIEIRSLTQQVVDSMRHRYEVTATLAGSTAIAADYSAGAVYAIELSERGWMNTLRVDGIKLLSAAIDADVAVRSLAPCA